ncbi:MAG: HDOD domain-containing protein [Gammaproteobacteria bacterium]|nr:HDOD domain-containing protein [Gammaproteobacteria bacterium]
MASANTQPNSATEIAFEFVRALANELSAGRVDLPSFPEVAIRVRRVLADEKSNLEKVVRVVGSEPALAARLLRIANSASLNTLGRQITDLRTAINRMGYNMVRSASMSFAMAQIRNNNKLAGVKPYLDELWERSTLVAAIAFVLARKCTRINADEAMLTGMMHGIGKLYVLTRVADHPELFDSGATVNRIIDEWHAQIGRAILENWEFAEEMVAAVGDQDDVDREGPESADLSDVIAVANLMASFATDDEGLQVACAGRASIARLGLDHEKMTAIMKDTAVEVAALRSALGG